MPTPTTATRDTAARILDATLAVMSDYGMARLSLEDVARRAGLSRQTLYRYFSSKEVLLTATVLREEQVFIDNVLEAADRETDLGAAVAAAVTAALRTAADHTLLNRLLSTEPETLVPLLSTDGPVLSSARRAWEALLGNRLPDLPAHQLTAVADAVARLLVSYVVNPAPEGPERIGARLAALLTPGLAGVSPTPAGGNRSIT